MTTGFWAPFLVWVLQHALYPLLRRHRASEVLVMQARGIGGAAQGTFRTHLSSRMDLFGEFAACGAYVVSLGGPASDVDCRACKRIIRTSQKETP